MMSVTSSAEITSNNIQAAEENYSGMTVSELKVIAREKGITGYSSMNKSELISAIQAMET